MPTAPSSARAAAADLERAAESPWLDRLARVGLAARGLVYVLIGVLAARIAFGHHDRSADQRGAFETLARNGFGRALLWLVVVGLAGYALWQLSEAAFGYRDEDGAKRTAKRLKSVGKAAAYLGLSFAAAKAALRRPSGSKPSETATARLLQHSGGRPLVVLAGLVVIGVGCFYAYRGAAKEFERSLALSRLSSTARSTVVRVGQVGHVARGAVFCVIGALVVAAAVTFDPSKARGFDAALTTLSGQPYGRVLLLLVAAGLACFGVYSFVEARYRRL